MTYKEYCKEELGYDTISTFFADFSIAERFGFSAIKDTYKRAFNEWKTDYKMLTELVMVLNHKIWFNYESNEPLARIYNELWEEADQWASDNLKGDELDYFYRVLD